MPSWRYEEVPQARIIVPTTSEADAEMRRALRAGAPVHAGNRCVLADIAARLAERGATANYRTHAVDHRERAWDSPGLSHD